MMSLDEVRGRLRDRRISIVAAEARVHRNTISAIVSGRSLNPSYRVMKALTDYFVGVEQ